MKVNLMVVFILTFILVRRSHNIVVLDEFLLFCYHVFEVNNCPGLQLKVEEKLDVLTFQEIVLDNQLKIILDVFVFYTAMNRVTNVPDVLIVGVQTLLHRVSFYQVLLCGLVQNQNLLLLLSN
jgi:hypothetical protein